MKQRGSAILIAVFLITAVGSVAFGIGRLFMMESTLANLYESSTVAYYAAESGIEEGFLRYRYNKNTELPLDAFGKYSTSKVSTNNLNDSKQSNLALDAFYNSVIDNIEYYTLSMSYKNNYYGYDVDSSGGVNGQDLNSPDYPKEYTIARDESVKIDISDAAAGNITLLANFEFDSGTTGGEAFIEAKLIGETPLGLKEIKAALTPSNLTIPGIFPNGSAVGMSSAGFGYTYQLSNIVTEMRNTTSMSGTSPIFNSGTKVELYLKPIKCQVKIALVPLSSVQIAGPFSTIKSTGYYGGVTRTLEARIDRQAGTVYDLFDYVLYKKP